MATLFLIDHSFLLISQGSFTCIGHDNVTSSGLAIHQTFVFIVKYIYFYLCLFKFAFFLANPKSAEHFLILCQNSGTCSFNSSSFVAFQFLCCLFSLLLLFFFYVEMYALHNQLKPNSQKSIALQKQKRPRFCYLY